MNSSTMNRFENAHNIIIFSNSENRIIQWAKEKVSNDIKIIGVSDMTKILVHRYEIEARYDQMLLNKFKFDRENVLVIGNCKEIAHNLTLLGCLQKSFGANYCFIIGLTDYKNNDLVKRFITNCEYHVYLNGETEND